ncbi:MAG: potassium transporter TrkG [Ignavibacteria bacterium]
MILHIKDRKKNIFEKFTTAQTLLLGYLIFITAGSILLMLPVSLAENNSLSIIDAVFTTTSAISGTGLIIVDTANYFTYFGQFVIMMLIQVGNIGYMLFFALAVILLGGRLSFFNKVMIRESISTSKLDLMLFTRKVFKYTFIIEGVSALLLTVYWTNDYGFFEALRLGVFHSISAFCTAGFSLFRDNLAGFHNDYFVNFSIIATSYAGSLGFFVIYDLSMYAKKLRKKNSRAQLSTHSKLALTTSVSLIIAGTLFLILSEGLNPKNHEYNLVLTAFFQSGTSSTSAGFNTVNVGILSNASLFAMVFLMFIGASPSGTGGGIKTTVFASLVLALFTFIFDKKNVNVFKRTIKPVNLTRAFSIMLMGLSWIFISVLLLTMTENQEFLHILFETVSALGNNGISAGFTPELSFIGKIILSLTMLIGRVGPLIIGYAIGGGVKSEFYKYPDANILIV